MFIINPNNFQGCKSNLRINLENKDYKPGTKTNIYIYFDDGNYRIFWEFDNPENRDKAIKRIDTMVGFIKTYQLEPFISIKK